MKKVLIIGGGVAGLSAGIYARLSGYEAVVCERHYIAGGNLTGWDRDGYHIDNCIHWLTGTNPNNRFYKMWEELGVLGDVKIIKGSSLFTSMRGGKSASLACTLEGLRREMLAVSEGDEREIDRLIRAVDFLMGSDNIAGENCDEGITLKRFSRGIGPLLRYFPLTTGQLAARFKSPALQCLITGFWGDDFGALALLYVYATYCGGNGALPEGGSTAMAERMVKRFTSLGGELRLRKEAVKLNIEGERAASVTFGDGSTESADYIILTTDPSVTFGTLVDLEMPKKLRKLYNDPKMRRFSAYHCAFACDSAELPFEGDIIFDAPEDKVDMLHTKQVILREFSHEPSFAPEGKNILQTLTFTYEEDSLEFIKLRDEDREGYKAKKALIAATMQEIIEDALPTLRGKLRLIDVWTPASYRRYVRSEIGSFMSFAMPKGYLPVPMDGVVDGLDNLCLATQWQQAPGGLPIAAEAGKKAIELINTKERK